VGISVSRVGGKAQTKAMKKVAGRLRLDLAQFRELAAFSQFGSDLDKATQEQLTRGARMVELLKQGQYEPLPVERQVAIIYAGTQGYLDDLDIIEVRDFETGLYEFLDKDYADLMHDLKSKYELTDAIEGKLKKAIAAWKEQFKAKRGSAKK
jgi:F-type H+-transporting ATPase subunit alpha